MDDRRFDALVRNLGRGASRRWVLAGLAGAALGTIGRRRAGAQWYDPTGAGTAPHTGMACGGPDGVGCPGGFFCADAPADDCDPAAGGAGCPGLCVPVPAEDPDPAADPCAAVRCRDGYACCSECGGTCEPVGGPSSCAAALCAEGTTCCDICGAAECVPAGKPCPTRECAGEPCNQTTCGEGEYCCNYSCSTCSPLDGACSQVVCE